MDSIKIYDLENIELKKCNRLKSDLRITVCKIRGNGKMGTRLLTFNFENEAIQNGFNRMNFAENSLTGDIYIVLSKDRGVQIKAREGRQGGICTKVSVVDLLLKILKQEVKPVSIDLKFSVNLSKTDDQFTYKIEEVTIL